MNITIAKDQHGSFFVLDGERFADRLTYEEMLGVVAQLAMPAERRALGWLKTADEWREQDRSRAAFLSGLEAQASDAAKLREETIALAVKQDGADQRVREDWCYFSGTVDPGAWTPEVGSGYVPGEKL